MKRFRLSHSFFGTVALIVVEAIVFAVAPSIALATLFVVALAGAGLHIYVAVEVVEDIRGTMQMIIYFCGVVAEFIIFFAFQYLFLAALDPNAFPTLGGDAISLMLHSTMIFVFNPIYAAQDDAGRALLLINTLGALGLVLFIFQNIAQFRRKNTDVSRG